MSLIQTLLIGSDSFIAQKFIEQSPSIQCRGIARQGTSLKDEVVLDDFYKISPDTFKNIDAVINFAAIVHQPDQNDENLYEQINYQLPVFLAKLAKKSGVRQFTQISTIAVYGNLSLINKDTTSQPQNAYGKYKLKADNELLALMDDTFIVSVVRPSMVYGGGNAPGNMLKLINVTEKNIPLPFKNVKNARQFCNIHLLIDVLTEIIKQQKAGTYLVADKNGISTYELLQKISKLADRKVWLFQPPTLFLSMLKKAKPLLYDKLYGSLVIDVNHTFESLSLKDTKYSMDEALAEMIKS